jgi:diaminopimelate epimerase
MRFTKAHGTGNDFIVIPDWGDDLEIGDDLVRALCDRRHGIGADGLIRLVPPEGEGDVFMDHRNADGSRPEMCGNGVRVVAKYLVDRDLVDRPGATVNVATRSGVKSIEVERDEDGRVTSATVEMGAPILTPADIPFDSPDSATGKARIDVGGETVELSAVSMGNPHAVIVVDDVETAAVERLGSAIERHDRFPKGTNVEFVEIIAPDHLRVRVWERGVGETAACGTGACATLVALQRLGLAGDEVRLELPGGEVTVRYVADENSSVLLTGGAVEVATGIVDDAWIAHAVSRGGKAMRR